MEIPQEVLDKVGLDAELRAMAESAAAKFAAADGNLDPAVAAEEAVAESEETARAADEGGYEMDWLPPVAVPGGGGTQINIDPNGIVAVSTEYTDASYVDPVTEAAHPYAIKMARGHLAIVNGALTVTVDPQITQYIDTVPLSSVLLAT